MPLPIVGSSAAQAVEDEWMNECGNMWPEHISFQFHMIAWNQRGTDTKDVLLHQLIASTAAAVAVIMDSSDLLSQAAALSALGRDGSVSSRFTKQPMTPDS